VAKFVIKCNEKGIGCIFNRLERIYSHIFIDEVQDLAGYDLEILKNLFNSKCEILIVCDPRQSTYSTNSSGKNIQFKKAFIVNFFEEHKDIISIDTDSLTVNHRCVDKICNLSNKLFPFFPTTSSGNKVKTNHDGVFLVKPKDVDAYLAMYKPVQLRDSIKTPVNPKFQVMNFGDSKGLSFDRVLIYPTNPIYNWLMDHNSDLKPGSRSKFYVALTRARQSVGIVFNYLDDTNIEHADKYINE
jgi:superfamily I DNA/RNA helicase